MNKRAQFQLFQNQLDLAHSYWKKLLCPGDIVIDATCGNGHDTLTLANLAFSPNSKQNIIAIDMQSEAIKSTQVLLKNHFKDPFESLRFLQQCHSQFPSDLTPQSVKLIVYNLGYLPGGNKTITTAHSSTLESLRNALDLIMLGGAISITCYPGHPEGKIEEKKILAFSQTLSPLEWSCCYHRWENRKDAPGLLLMQRHL